MIEEFGEGGGSRASYGDKFIRSSNADRVTKGETWRQQNCHEVCSDTHTCFGHHRRHDSLWRLSSRPQIRGMAVTVRFTETAQLDHSP
jgi:hypothetical protein